MGNNGCGLLSGCVVTLSLLFQIILIICAVVSHHMYTLCHMIVQIFVFICNNTPLI